MLSFSEFREVLWLSVVINCAGENRKRFSVQQWWWWYRRRESWESCSFTEYTKGPVAALYSGLFFCSCECRDRSLLRLISHCDCDLNIDLKKCGSKKKLFALCRWRTDVKNMKIMSPIRLHSCYTANVSTGVHCLPVLHRHMKYKPTSKSSYLNNRVVVS